MDGGSSKELQESFNQFRQTAVDKNKKPKNKVKTDQASDSGKTDARPKTAGKGRNVDVVVDGSRTTPTDNVDNLAAGVDHLNLSPTSVLPENEGCVLNSGQT